MVLNEVPKQRGVAPSGTHNLIQCEYSLNGPQRFKASVPRSTHYRLVAGSYQSPEEILSKPDMVLSIVTVWAVAY